MAGNHIFRVTWPRNGGFSTVFSTGVEILGQKPKHRSPLALYVPARSPRLYHLKSQIPSPKTRIHHSRNERLWNGAWDLEFGVWDLVGLVLKIPPRDTRAAGFRDADSVTAGSA